MHALTLTVRHNDSDSLTRLQQGIVGAWRHLIQGAPWKRLVADLGIRHHVRAIQVTHNHGWHVHIHALFLTTVVAPDIEKAAADRLLSRWCDSVERVLGRRYRPSASHQRWGLSSMDDYMARAELPYMGAGPERGSEQGRIGRSIWELAAGALKGEENDLRLWKEFVRSMRGTRLATWSRELRRAAAEWPCGQDAGALNPANLNRTAVTRTLVAVIPAALWDRASHCAGFRGALNRAAVRDGTVGVATILAAGLRRVLRNQILPPPHELIEWLIRTITPPGTASSG